MGNNTIAINVVLQFLFTFIAAHLTVDNDIPDGAKTLTWVFIGLVVLLYAVWQCIG